MHNRHARQSERGAALLEAAVTIPILLFIAVGIFEFGRAYQTWQVLTNAAREGARVAVLPDPTPGLAEQRVRDYMKAGQLKEWSSALVDVNRSSSLDLGGTTVPASQVTIDYPFQFIVLQPIARLVTGGTSSVGTALTMRAQALMRNESS
jgi:Flp pilus assembly protein TadG